MTQSNPAIMYNYTDCIFDRQFGYHADYDDRDNNYLMRDVAKYHFAYSPPGRSNSARMRDDRVLDQGVTQLSPAYAWRHWLSASPNATSLGPDVMTLVDYARKHVPKDIGVPTTMRACARALLDMGHIEIFLWAKNAYDIRNWMQAEFGPVVITAPWYDNMSDPTNRVAHARGDIVAWHSFVLLSYQNVRNVFIMLNSHGVAWGAKGRKYIPFNDVQFLFDNGAIACSSPTKYIGVSAREQAQRNRKLVVTL